MAQRQNTGRACYGSYRPATSQRLETPSPHPATTPATQKSATPGPVTSVLCPLRPDSTQAPLKSRPRLPRPHKARACTGIGLAVVGGTSRLLRQRCRCNASPPSRIKTLVFHSLVYTLRRPRFMKKICAVPISKGRQVAVRSQAVSTKSE